MMSSSLVFVSVFKRHFLEIEVKNLHEVNDVGLKLNAEKCAKQNKKRIGWSNDLVRL